MLQMRQNGPDRVRVGDICDHPQRAATQRADRNIDIKYTLGSGANYNSHNAWSITY
ncbi:MAG: hypothetical protein HOM44_08975 [Gammaproteobacteria bacterium]|nr:hypothetical protein [Gammaproteobacteria bacterium]MBT5154207.1 hypothetical protein [Gammaproteobacteria bacterium]